MARQLASVTNGLVLLAENHLKLPIKARNYLEERYQLVKIGDDKAAAAWLQTNIPNLVIADVTARHVNGYSLCRTIVHNPMFASVSVLLISFNSPEAWLTALDEGADDCMGDPIDLRRFGMRVKNLVARSRRIRELLLSVSSGLGQHELDTRQASFAYEPASLLKRVETAIDANLDNPHFSIRSLARSVAMGRASLYRQLGMIGDTPPGRLILERRLQHATFLFENCGITVTEVAQAVGFKSLSHFSRSFRKYHGITPSAYLARAADRNAHADVTY